MEQCRSFLEAHPNPKRIPKDVYDKIRNILKIK